MTNKADQTLMSKVKRMNRYKKSLKYMKGQE